MELIINFDNVFISDINTIHVDYFPANLEIKKEVIHGAEINYTSSNIEQAIQNYLSTAKQEILSYLNSKYPNLYY
jgi:hypothetical protein